MFRNDLAISWTRGFYKNSGENILVPSDLIYYGYENDDHRICFGDSSGTAAHMDYEMAFKGALLELIERDALMRNWYERKPPVKISNDILPVHVKHRMEYWKAKGRNVYVLDMNSPYAATFQVVIVGEDYPCFVSGAATTIDNFEEAIQKALQEAEFSLLLDLQKKETVRISPKEVSSPQDHGNLYADKTYMNHISWLWSGEEKRKFDFKNTTIADLVTKLNPIVVDLSEEGADIKVLCVLSEHCIPISFGYGMDYYTHNALKDLNVNMENRKLPHYFA